jgi:hypothetical protein
MDCPLCNTEVEHETLRDVLKPMKELKEIIKDRALKRLHYLKEENAKEIVEKGKYCDFCYVLFRLILEVACFTIIQLVMHSSVIATINALIVVYACSRISLRFVEMFISHLPEAVLWWRESVQC